MSTEKTPKKDHPKLAQFLREYRAKHGIESVQVKKDGALHPLKAAKAWAEYIKQK